MFFFLDDALSQIRDNSATGAARMALPASARSVPRRYLLERAAARQFDERRRQLLAIAQPACMPT